MAGWPLDADPYDKVVAIQGHRHSEPICAWPDCETYLTREQMDALADVSGVSTPPSSVTS